MINTNRFLLGLVLGTAALVPLTIPQPAQAQTAAFKAKGRQGILSAYKIQEQALPSRNVASFMTTVSPDYQEYSLDGTVSDYSQTEAALHDLLEKPNPDLGVPIRLTKAKAKILSISWRGSEAIVNVQTTVVGVAHKYGRTATVEIVGVSREFWTPTRAGWKIRQSVTKQMTSWLNGKKFKSVFR